MTQTPVRRRYRRYHYDWAAWYSRHMCTCGHFDTAHRDKGAGACEGQQEGGPCACQKWEKS